MWRPQELRARRQRRRPGGRRGRGPSFQQRPTIGGLGGGQDRPPEDDIGKPDSEMADHHPPLGPRRPGDERLAERRAGFGVILERPVRASVIELAAVVDEEQGSLASHRRRAVRGVVDRHDERIRREPVVGHDLADRPEGRDRHHDIGSRDGLASTRGDLRGAHARRPSRLLQECRGPLDMAIEQP